jgi:hypothetical protein
MKKRKAFLVAVTAAVLIAGCNGRGGTSTLDSQSSRIFVTNEGALQTSTVETYEDQAYYSEQEWKAELETAVAKFNAEHGEGAVKLNSSSMGKGTARMVFDYATGEDLAAFTEKYRDTANLVSGITVSELKNTAASFAAEEVTFLKAADGKTATTEELVKNGDYHVVVIEGEHPVTVQTEGRISFVSDNAKIVDHYTAQTDGGKSYIIFK